MPNTASCRKFKASNANHSIVLMNQGKKLLIVLEVHVIATTMPRYTTDHCRIQKKPATSLASDITGIEQLASS